MPDLYTVGYYLLVIVSWILHIYAYVFLADAITSWFLPPANVVRRFLLFLTEPIVSLFRPLSDRITRNSHVPISLAHLFGYFFIILLQKLISILINWIY